MFKDRVVNFNPRVVIWATSLTILSATAGLTYLHAYFVKQAWSQPRPQPRWASRNQSEQKRFGGGALRLSARPAKKVAESADDESR